MQSFLEHFRTVFVDGCKCMNVFASFSLHYTWEVEMVAEISAQTTHMLSCFCKFTSTGLCVSKGWLKAAHACWCICRNAVRTRKIQTGICVGLHHHYPWAMWPTEFNRRRQSEPRPTVLLTCTNSGLLWEDMSPLSFNRSPLVALPTTCSSTTLRPFWRHWSQNARILWQTASIYVTVFANLNRGLSKIFIAVKYLLYSGWKHL